MGHHEFITTIEYINNLKVDYWESYSLQRGCEFIKYEIGLRREFKKLQLNGNHSSESQGRYSELDRLLNKTQFIIDKDGRFHKTATKISSFESNDLMTVRLREILDTEAKDILIWMCAPFYRDAIVFYNANKDIVSSLNVCLSCDHLNSDGINFVGADTEVYDKLKIFFRGLGHIIEG